MGNGSCSEAPGASARGILAKASEHYPHEDGNKTTLQTPRSLLFEKQKFTLKRDADGNFILTLLDANAKHSEEHVAGMLDDPMKQGQNEVLWGQSRPYSMS
jgi:hypothetical protein